MSEEDHVNALGAESSSTDDLRSELREKPGIWAIAATMAAVIAIPVGILAVWFPREIDGLRRDVMLSVEQASASVVEAEAAKETSEKVLDRLENLVFSIARNDATQSFNNGFIAVSEFLPRDLVAAVEAAKAQSAFRYSNFGGDKWVFINSQVFNRLDSDKQRALSEALQRVDARVTVDEAVPLYVGLKSDLQ